MRLHLGHVEIMDTIEPKRLLGLDGLDLASHDASSSSLEAKVVWR